MKKNGFINEILVNHLIKGWGDMIDGNRVISKTEDAVKFAEGKREARFLHSLGEQLSFDGQIANPQVVTRDKSLHGTRSVFDRKG